MNKIAILPTHKINEVLRKHKIILQEDLSRSELMTELRKLLMSRKIKVEWFEKENL